MPTRTVLTMMRSSSRILDSSSAVSLESIFGYHSFFLVLLFIVASLFSSFLWQLVETPELKDSLIRAHQYLLSVSEVEDREVFKSCLEYWNKLVTDLYNESAFAGEPSLLATKPSNQRKLVYSQILSRLRVVMINKMAKPEEVFSPIFFLSVMGSNLLTYYKRFSCRCWSWRMTRVKLSASSRKTLTPLHSMAV